MSTKDDQRSDLLARPTGYAAWVAVDEEAPPENVKVRCLTEKHGEADGVRKGRCIHVGLQDGWKPSVTHWRHIAESSDSRP